MVDSAGNPVFSEANATDTAPVAPPKVMSEEDVNAMTGNGPVAGNGPVGIDIFCVVRFVTSVCRCGCDSREVGCKGRPSKVQ